MKITFDMNSREPDVEFFEHDAVGQADSAKQLRFSKFKEANIGAIENNTGGINIAPAYALFDGVLLQGVGSRVSGFRF
jgi:hypothetical protein